jgi:hypothetical protein
MGTLSRNLIIILLVTISLLSTGCVTNKSYRDATGVVKTDTRSAVGVNK